MSYNVRIGKAYPDGWFGVECENCCREACRAKSLPSGIDCDCLSPEQHEEFMEDWRADVNTMNQRDWDNELEQLMERRP